MHKLLYNIASSFFPPPQIVQIPENLMTASAWTFITRSEVVGGRWGSDLAKWAGWGRFPSGQSVRKILVRAFTEGSCEPELRELLNQRRVIQMISWHNEEGSKQMENGTSQIWSELVKREVYRQVFLPCNGLLYALCGGLHRYTWLYLFFRDKVDS